MNPSPSESNSTRSRYPPNASAAVYSQWVHQSQFDAYLSGGGNGQDTLYGNQQDHSIHSRSVDDAAFYYDGGPTHQWDEGSHHLNADEFDLIFGPDGYPVTSDLDVTPGFLNPGFHHLEYIQPASPQALPTWPQPHPQHAPLLTHTPHTPQSRPTAPQTQRNSHPPRRVNETLQEHQRPPQPIERPNYNYTFANTTQSDYPHPSRSRADSSRGSSTTRQPTSTSAYEGRDRGAGGSSRVHRPGREAGLQFKPVDFPDNGQATYSGSSPHVAMPSSDQVVRRTGACGNCKKHKTKCEFDPGRGVCRRCESSDPLEPCFIPGRQQRRTFAPE